MCERKIYYLFLFLIFVCCRTSSTTMPDKINGLSLDIYRKLTSVSENVFFSPISISFALAMTSLGARGNTLAEMKGVLGVEDLQAMHEWFKGLGKEFLRDSSQDQITLSLANRLFAEKSHSFLDEFLQKSLEYYNAEQEKLDFISSNEASQKYINDWVFKVTEEKIKNLIPNGVITSLTKLVLVNAIYFKGDWLTKFSAGKTRDRDFEITKDEIIQVPMMHEKMNAKYGYSNELKSEVLELPYKGEKLSMLILLPNLEETSMEQLESALSLEILCSLPLRKQEVNIYLPKFKLEGAFDLKSTLQQLGMRDIFDNGKADLSGIDGTRDLHVSAALHKAFIDVNEEGTEAAAATAIMINTRSLQIVMEFKADHPFIFLIKDTSNTNLFLGKVVRPK